MENFTPLVALVSLVLSLSCKDPQPTIRVVPTPDAEAELLAAIQRAGVRESMHGVVIADPFRAFEQGNADTAAWLELATRRALTQSPDAAVRRRIAELDALPRVLDAYADGTHAVVEELREGRRVWVHRSTEGEQVLSDDVVAAAVHAAGRIALLVATEAGHSLIVGEETIEGVAPVAPVWEGNALLYAAFPGPGEPGYDGEGSAPRVRRRAPSGEETVVFDQARTGDVLRIGAEDDVRWYEIRRGEQRDVFLDQGGAMRALPARRLGPGPRIAQGRIWMADDEAVHSAPLVHAHEPAVWQRVEAVVSDLGRIEGEMVALLPGLVSQLRVVHPSGLGEELDVPLGQILALRDDWIIWTDPLTPPVLVRRARSEGEEPGSERWTVASQCRLARRTGFVAARLDDAPRRWVVEVQGALGVDASLGFRPGIAVWLERGGGWAYVDAPGGGGFGSARHRRGRGRGKSLAVHAYQAVLDDAVFSDAQLFAYGSGHGGVLAASVLGEGLVRGLVLHDPVTDLVAALRAPPTDSSLVGEYGALADAETVTRLLELSPYHRVVHEPHAPTWIEIDPRAHVPPMHGAKLAARLALEGSTWLVHERSTLVDRWARAIAFLER